MIERKDFKQFDTVILCTVFSKNYYKGIFIDGYTDGFRNSIKRWNIIIINPDMKTAQTIHEVATIIHTRIVLLEKTNTVTDDDISIF